MIEDTKLRCPQCRTRLKPAREGLHTVSRQCPDDSCRRDWIIVVRDDAISYKLAQVQGMRSGERQVL